MVVPSEVKFLLDIEKNTGVCPPARELSYRPQKKMEEFEHSEEDALLYLNKALTARQVAILVRIHPRWLTEFSTWTI